MRTSLFFNSKNLNPLLAAKLIGELEEKGLYSNGQIVYDEEQEKVVREILDKYIINE